MRFLVDAQLPQRLAKFLSGFGHDSIHTLELPSQNRTHDTEISQIATAEDRIVITKDEDFVDSHLLRGLPPRLLLISTGNISNQELFKLFQAHLPLIESAFHGSSFVELTLIAVVAH